MADIEYLGIVPEAVELINSDEFNAVLEANPELSLITVEEFEGAEVFYKVELPVPEDHDESVAVIDVDNRGSFMWVLNDRYCFIEDPSPAFIEILKIMDSFSVENREERLFTSSEQEICVDSPEVLAADFDFTTGGYKL